MITKNLGLVYFLLPFLKSPSVVKNKFGLILSVLTGKSTYKLKLKNGSTLKISNYDTMKSFLGAISIAASYSITSDKIELSFDENTKFTIPSNDLSQEDRNLLDILFYGTMHGANFVTNDVDIKRDKTFKIIQNGHKKIIETPNGIKFYIDSIHTLNTIVECFVDKIHTISSHDDWSDKIVIDVGAECGDTPLYYASMGAKVYAFEPIKANFEAMIRNLTLNPELSKQVIPINAGIGKDGTLTFYQNPENPEIGSSFVYNIFGKNAKLSRVKCYTLESMIKEFNISHVDLLKMDCKGCETFLTEDALKNIDKVKIEYMRDCTDLLRTLKRAGFDYVIYKHSPFDYRPINVTGHIYATKKLFNLKVKN